MATTTQYNELTNDVQSWSTGLGLVDDTTYSWDTAFPEKLSRLHLGEFGSPIRHFGSPIRQASSQQRRGRVPSRTRYRTQPVTFVEIQEAEDEDLASVGGGGGSNGGHQKVTSSDIPNLTSPKEVLWGHFEEFSRRVGSRLARDDSVGRSDTDSEHSTTASGSPGTTPTGSYLLQEYERRRKRSQRRKRGKSIEEVPEAEKGD